MREISVSIATTLLLIGLYMKFMQDNPLGNLFLFFSFCVCVWIIALDNNGTNHHA